MIDQAQLHKNVLLGNAGEQIIWQPRMSLWYTRLVFNDIPLPPPYTSLTLPEIYRMQNTSDRLYEYYNLCFHKVEHPEVKKVKEKINDKDTKVTIMTPVGNQIRVNRWDPKAGLKVIKWEIGTKEELEVAIWRAENTNWEWDQEKFDQNQKDVGDLGAPIIFLPRTNIQRLSFDKMGFDNAFFALNNWTSTVERYFKALEECHFRLIDVINPSPIEIICLGDSIDQEFLPLEYFKKYYLPSCQRKCDKLHAAGKFVCAHWDGDCAKLLPYIKETGIDGVESLTPKPQGDITLENIKNALGDDIFLIDGIPSILFDPIFSIDELIQFTHKIIDMFAPKLVLGISEELSPEGEIERLPIVRDIVNDYNASH